MSGMQQRTCNSCGQQASGSFCQHCGESLNDRGVGPSPGWWFAGFALFAFMLAVGGMVVGADPEAPTAAPGAATGSPGPVDVSQLTPRQMADQLFDHVMRASDAGDLDAVTQFMPIAMEAYESARPLDLDGHFHVALLQRTGEAHEASLTTALGMLEEEPTHLLALDAAARASSELGRSADATEYYRSFVLNFESESARDLSEYQGHRRYLAAALEDARAFLSEM